MPPFSWLLELLLEKDRSILNIDFTNEADNVAEALHATAPLAERYCNSLPLRGKDLHDALDAMEDVVSETGLGDELITATGVAIFLNSDKMRESWTVDGIGPETVIDVSEIDPRQILLNQNAGALPSFSTFERTNPLSAKEWLLWILVMHRAFPFASTEPTRFVNLVEEIVSAWESEWDDEEDEGEDDEEEEEDEEE